MADQTRDIILDALKKAPRSEALPPRPARPPVDGACRDTEALVERFRERLEEQAVEVIRVAGNQGVLQALAKIFDQMSISCAAASDDPIIAGLNLPGWAERNKVIVTTHRDYADRNSFKKAVFTEAQAGITGVDYGIAESGTLCLLAGPEMPRLTSLAPVTHIAVLPVDRLVAHYEDMARRVFENEPPSQLIWITGPSQTGDIQATLFRGMHGPRHLIVILRDA